MSETLQQLPLSKLREADYNPRKHFGDLTDLADTIRTHGILQPIRARPVGDAFEIFIGHRRFRAAKIVGLKTAPVIVEDISKQEALEKAIIENDKRQNVTPLEMAESLEKLMRDFNLNAEQAAARVGIGRSTFYVFISLLDLVDPAKKALEQGKFSVEAGKWIARVRGDRVQLQAFNDAMKLAKNGELPSARAVERMVRERYLAVAKKGLTKHQKTAREHGAEVALRRRVIERLLRRVAELVERKAHLDEADLRTAVLALAEVLGETARLVFQRRGLRVDRLGKVGAAQLRSLLVELPLAAWLALDDAGEYRPAVKATAKAYDVSLSELATNLEAEGAADALFKRDSAQ
jgi:ParB/RepB/Spo0J family partition protein